MQPFEAAPHTDVLLLLVQVASLLACARILGEICVRYGQPSVIGELGAGILLGPSVLGTVFPAVGRHLVPQTQGQGHILEVVSMLGAIFLLLVTGLETDLGLIRQHLRTALGVSVGGICFTFASGYLLGYHLPDELLANPDRRILFSLFLATAMSISAIPVVAKVLMDLKLMRRDVGQTILAAGMSDDTTGWVLLSIVAAMAGGGKVGLLQIGGAVGKVVLFLVVSFTIGRWVVRRSLAFTQDHVVSRDRLVTLVVVFAFAFGAFAQALGLEAVLGAFVAGILFSSMPRLPKEVPHLFESVALGVFAPVFFGVAGLKVDIKGLLEPRLLGITILVILVACLGKVVGTYLGARILGKQDHWTALSFGAGLNARGAMEIIIATIGLSLGILSQTMFSMIVVMAMATSVMAPTALRFALSRVKPNHQERLRLDREAQAAKNALPPLHRILLPLRYGRTGVPAENVIYEMLSSEASLSLTLLTVVEPGQKQNAEEWIREISQYYSGGEIVTRVVESTDPAEAIVEESKKDYQLVLLGATQGDSCAELFSNVIDRVVRFAACTTAIYRPGECRGGSEPRHLLVPTNGSLASRRAAEFALLLASGNRGFVEFLHVVSRDVGGVRSFKRDLEHAHHAVTELVSLGESQEISCGSDVRVADSSPGVIVEVAHQSRADLVLLGTDLRPGGRLFLGPAAERVLRTSKASVLVVNE